ncbi:MAG: hypothetical protein SF123_15310 [Chloroflexota bacterium]|nr:hypothetical protein [Chloroflexota bacterium]
MMATLREELHALIDRLPEDELDVLWQQFQDERPKADMLEWIQEASELRVEIARMFPDLPPILAILDEVREERLNDLMGGR